ncbi:MAG: hypothetical protein J0I06_06645 [Planctomycetes bacterium]|nr:hypothetical protein [Planctomycetota bacterium]
MWPAFVFNLVAALLIAGWYLRAVRRLERRMDERMRKFEEWADAEDAKFDIARDEIKASLREKVDRAIAEMEANFRVPPTGEVAEAHVTDTLKFTQSAKARPTGVPTEEEIRELPLWARVAFAARCARRVLPRFEHFWTKAPKHHLEALSKAVRFAEHAAQTAKAPHNAEEVAHAADLVRIAFVTDPIYRECHDNIALAAYAARNAVYAVSDVARAVTLATRADVACVLDRDVTHSAHFAVSDAAKAATDEKLIRHDFETIYSLAWANGWTDATPVPPSVFDPLWLESEKPATEVEITPGETSGS